MTTAAEPTGDALTKPSTTGYASDRTATRILPGGAVAAIASIGAGAIHAAAAGIHAEHPALARIFVVTAVLQLGAGLLALHRPGRPIALAVAAINAAAVVGWLLTRLTGISWIAGLEASESPQFADSACATLGAIAVAGALPALLLGWQRARPTRLLVPGLLTAALTVPAMMTGSTHVHRHDAGATSDHDAASVPAVAGVGAAGATAHDDGHVDEAAAVGEAEPVEDTTAATATTHSHGTTATPATANWPRPWDPTQPIDLAGVEGVTPEQQARATLLVADSLRELPTYATVEAAVAAGYRSIGDAATGSEHYIRADLIQDDDLLDAAAPESLVYTVNGSERNLAGAMYIAPAQPTDSPTLVDWAGPLMQWHNHGNLCWDRDASGAPKVVGIVDANGVCARGINTGGANPMVHVWITPHPCGVFAALEGVGAGQTAVAESERVDLCTAAHDHGA